METHIEIAGKSIGDGILAGVARFIKVNNANVTPGTKSLTPGPSFIIALMDEFKDGANYPFKESFRAKMDAVTTEVSNMAEPMIKNGEQKQFEAMARVVGLGETINFLDANRAEALKIIATIRGDDLVELDTNSKVQ